MKPAGILLLILYCCLSLIPVAISILIVWQSVGNVPEKRRKPVMIIAALLSAIGNGAAYFVLHKHFVGHWNFIKYTFNALVNLQCTGAKMWAGAKVMIVTLPLAVIGGLLLRLLLCRTLRRNPGKVPGKRLTAFLYLLIPWPAMAVAAALCIEAGSLQALRINEVYSHGKDKIGYYSVSGDYVEIINTGSMYAQLEGCGLTDDPDQPFKYVIGKRTVAPGYMAVVYPDTFSVDSRGGETVYLFDVNGKLIDSIETVSSERYTSYQRLPDGTGKFTTGGATPGTANREEIRYAEIEAPELSLPSGTYAESILVAVTSENIPEGAGDIRYTLDGSIPDADSPLYTEPVKVEAKVDESGRITGTVFRAAVVDENGCAGDTVTATYFVGAEPNEKYIISLVTDPDALYAEEDGICMPGKEYSEWLENGERGLKPTANYWLKGKESERAADYELIYDGETVTSESVGIRIHGNGSRNEDIKRFRIIARDYLGGDKTLKYSPFEHENVKSVIFREGDENAICLAFAEGRDPLWQECIPATLYLNGEFHQEVYLMERCDEFYLAENTGVQKDSIELAGKAGFFDYSDIDTVNSYLITHSMTSEEDYRGLDEIIDIQSFIDVTCFNAYLANADYREDWNVITWRSTEANEDSLAGDGRWRWKLHDMDLLTAAYDGYASYQSDAEINSFAVGTKRLGWPPINEGPIYSKLRKNETFCRQFVLTFMDLVNTSFSVENAERILTGYGFDLSWNNYFFVNRAQYMVPYLAEEFDLTGSQEELTLKINDPQGGSIQLNTITPDLSAGTWTGTYYTDYPVTLTAIPAEGWHFTGWKGDVNSTETNISAEIRKGGTQLEAVFEKDE